jgi:hypothetical protein
MFVSNRKKRHTILLSKGYILIKAKLRFYFLLNTLRYKGTPTFSLCLKPVLWQRKSKGKGEPIVVITEKKI